MTGIDGQVAVVTGGASGIGQATALRLARDGANVAVLDRQLAGARETVRGIEDTGRRGIAVEVDVADGKGVLTAVEQARAALGPTTILVHAAGIGARVPFQEMTDAIWHEMISIHLHGTFHCARAVIADMLEAGWGRIVNISSTAALQGGHGLTHYAAAKAGMIGFSRALAAEVGRSGVTVNTVALGAFDTPMAALGAAEDFLAKAARATMVGRVGRPEEAAAMCAYLVSDEAGYVTGQVLSPNGGTWL